MKHSQMMQKLAVEPPQRGGTRQRPQRRDVASSSAKAIDSTRYCGFPPRQIAKHPYEPRGARMQRGRPHARFRPPELLHQELVLDATEQRLVLSSPPAGIIPAPAARSTDRFEAQDVSG